MLFRYSLTTRATPAQVFTAFTDFSDHRLEVWRKSLDPAKYEVRETGENWAVVPSLARPITDTVPLGAGAPAVDPAWRGSQMSSFLKTDTHLYEYITPSGRQGGAVVARVPLAGSPTADKLDGSATPPAASARRASSISRRVSASRTTTKAQFCALPAEGARIASGKLWPGGA